MKRKSEVTVNLVRPADDETYEILSDYDMTIARCRSKVIPERALFDEKKNTHYRFYIRMPK